MSDSSGMCGCTAREKWECTYSDDPESEDAMPCLCLCHHPVSDSYDELFRGIRLLIGLRQQGHIPTVERMLAEGSTWEEIGRVIGWHGPTAKRWYEIETAKVREAIEERQ